MTALAEENLHERFAAPAPENRILKIIHPWPDAPPAQDALINKLKAQGFGGVVCNVSFNEYLRSEQLWKAFERAVREARKAGMAMWLYDEKGYPSATAGGLVLKEHPEWQARGLLLSETNALGGAVSLELPPGELRLCAAFPVRHEVLQLEGLTDLQKYVQQRTVKWDAPKGSWRLIAITEAPLHEGTHADMSLSDHIPYPNLLDREPTARFIELTHAAYAARFPEGLSNYFVSTFTDEPSLMSLFLRAMPYRVLPWSKGFDSEFARRRGYAITPRIPALFDDAGPAGGKARYDYWRTVGELVSENFFGQIQQWCKSHDLRSGGHLLMEENLVNQVALYGDFFACLRRLDAPSIDCLTSIPEQVPWFIGRLAASAAALEGNTVVMCETSDHSQRYRPPGDKRPPVTVSKAQVRGTCNRLMVSGVNAITSYYTFAGLRDEDLRELNEWVGRCSAVLAGSQAAPDVAVLFPVESLWPRFVPARHLANNSPDAARIEAVFHSVSESLYTGGWDFMYVDGSALSQSEVQDGELVHRGPKGGIEQRWQTVILPGADTLPLAAWQKLADFVRQGGTLISAGSLPINSETEFPSAAVKRIASEIFGQTGAGSHVQTNANGGRGVFVAKGETALLPMYLRGLIAPAFEAEGGQTTLRCTRRITRSKDLWFVINDSSQPWTGTVALRTTGAGEAWDPATGTRAPLGQPSRVQTSLLPYDARFLVFDRAEMSAPRVRPKLTLPVVSPRMLPTGPPTIARGEFVRETVRPLEAASRGAEREITGEILKSDVDTFLFTRLEHKAGARLSRGEFLRLHTSVPEGQRSAVQLLVILHEKGGADYLAHTGRWLNSPGAERTLVPLAAFQLAGWSADENQNLDLDHVTEIRIGWGGYYGTEGERVQFGLGEVEVVGVE